MKTILQHQDIEVIINENILIIRNSKLCRKFDLNSGAPKTISLANKDNIEFASSEKTTADLAFIGMYSACANERIKWNLLDITAQIIPDSFLDSEHVKISITMEEPFAETKYQRDYIIYPNFPAISVQNSISLEVQPHVYWSSRGNLTKGRFFTEQRESIVDSICCAPEYQPKLAVQFRGRTDYNNELVVETPITNQEKINGNLLFCENNEGAGFLFLQEAPPSEERRDLEEYDFKITQNQIDSCCWGIHPSEAVRNSKFTSYRHDLILYSSLEERTTLLKDFLRLRFHSKTPEIMVNPWGCGKFRQYINEEFLLDEIKASSEVGADYYQIDDEWQTGKGLASIQTYNQRIRENFWTISQEKLNGSFDNIVKLANQVGIKPALWIAPSMNCEYEDWQTQAELILDFHKKYGFENFKIDGVLIRSKKAEDNLRSLLEYVRTQTNGKVSFNLDTTNGQRPGYFLFLEYGNIFLENRYCYTCFDAAYRYHPERTLRNLWDLTKYLNPQDLQIEIPCMDDINYETYKDKEDLLPDVYSQEYWAAISLFANPLLWTAPSKITQKSKDTIKKITSLHKKYRDELALCQITSIGEQPNGKAITGFLACNKVNKKKFLLLFREKDSLTNKITLQLPQIENPNWEIISGNGSITLTSNNTITIELNAKEYLFAQI